jgi:hypothetical protein
MLRATTVGLPCLKAVGTVRNIIGAMGSNLVASVCDCRLMKCSILLLRGVVWSIYLSAVLSVSEARGASIKRTSVGLVDTC